MIKGKVGELIANDLLKLVDSFDKKVFSIIKKYQ